MQIQNGEIRCWVFGSSRPLQDGDPILVDRYIKVPIWTFHGEADPVVPVQTTREMVAALEKGGGKPEVTYYPNVQHDSWTQTYDNLEVIRWLFRQHRD